MIHIWRHFRISTHLYRQFIYQSGTMPQVRRRSCHDFIPRLPEKKTRKAFKCLNISIALSCRCPTGLLRHCLLRHDDDRVRLLGRIDYERQKSHQILERA